MPLQIRDRLGYLNEYGTPRIERNEDKRNENRNPCVFLSFSQFACFFPPFFQKRESELPHPSAISSPLGFSQLEQQQGQSTNFYEVRSQIKVRARRKQTDWNKRFRIPIKSRRVERARCCEKRGSKLPTLFSPHHPPLPPAPHDNNEKKKPNEKQNPPSFVGCSSQNRITRNTRLFLLARRKSNGVRDDQPVPLRLRSKIRLYARLDRFIRDFSGTREVPY